MVAGTGDPYPTSRQSRYHPGDSERSNRVGCQAVARSTNVVALVPKIENHQIPTSKYGCSNYCDSRVGQQSAGREACQNVIVTKGVDERGRRVSVRRRIPFAPELLFATGRRGSNSDLAAPPTHPGNQPPPHSTPTGSLDPLETRAPTGTEVQIHRKPACGACLFISVGYISTPTQSSPAPKNT